jgi:lipid II:glycine glycyltransferase (peptidoglycan interpeptide bridge formation enzyme)
MYYLLSSRSKSAHSGSISLLIWTAIQDAIARGVTFDFDGIASSSILQFLSGFGGNLVQRISVERLRPAYIAARQLKYASVYLCQSVKAVVGSG